MAKGNELFAIVRWVYLLPNTWAEDKRKNKHSLCPHKACYDFLSTQDGGRLIISNPYPCKQDSRPHAWQQLLDAYSHPCGTKIFVQSSENLVML